MSVSLLRRKSERGNAIIELALCLLPLLALLLAIVDFSMPIFLRSLFSHAAREGARYGIAYRTQTGLGHRESIKRVVQRNAAGFLAGTTGLSKITVEFYVPGTTTPATGANANEGGNIVEVSINNYQWNHILPLSGLITGGGVRSAGGINVNARSSDRLESLPRNVARPAP